MLKVIAFDFDGTLADSVELCLAVFDRVLAKYLGDKAPSRADVLQKFGMNEPGILEQFLGKKVPEAEADFARFHRELHPKITPFPLPGIPALLDTLKAKGIHLCVVTGRSEITGSISFDYLKLKDFFEDYQFGASFHNDKSVQLENLLKKYHISPEELAYVGDAVSDVEACRTAGIMCLSAAWAGSAQKDALEKVNPGLVFFSTQDLLNALLEKHLI